MKYELQAFSRYMYNSLYDDESLLGIGLYGIKKYVFYNLEYYNVEKVKSYHPHLYLEWFNLSTKENNT